MKNKIKNKKLVFFAAVVILMLVLFLILSLISSNNKKDNNNGVVLNLNDNIKYYEVITCGRYSSIEEKCIDKTIGELKKMFPKYNKDLDKVEKYDSTDKLKTYDELFDYFPGCFKTIDSSTVKTLSKVEGVKFEFTEKFMTPYWIGFVDSKYSELEWSTQDYTKYDLYYDDSCEEVGGGSGSGNDKDPVHLILDEDKCLEYNLTCDRW